MVESPNSVRFGKRTHNFVLVWLCGMQKVFIRDAVGTFVSHNQSSHFCSMYSLITRWNPLEYAVRYVQILCFDSIVQIHH